MAKSNAELVERAVRILKEYNKEPATSGEAREILGINFSPVSGSV
ncbi:MAG: 3-keto-5-aminohexanoate cleavage protein [Desulfocucumaceae bacterium]